MFVTIMQQLGEDDLKGLTSVLHLLLNVEFIFEINVLMIVHVNDASSF